VRSEKEGKNFFFLPPKEAPQHAVREKKSIAKAPRTVLSFRGEKPEKEREKCKAKNIRKNSKRLEKWNKIF
jgi:hypothetical protein